MKKGISQEALKLIACITMLIDHIGSAVVYPMYQYTQIMGGVDGLERMRMLENLYLVMKIIGRLAFPIFCFLLVEGIFRTRNRKKYAIRLAVGALISELPFNLVVSGSPVWRYGQSVMLTLLLGFAMILIMERISSFPWKSVVVVPFAVAAELLNVDYGWHGIALIALFYISGHMYNRNLIRCFGMLVLFHYMSSRSLTLGGFTIPMQALGALSILFIAAYDGRKLTHSKAVQWAFYLFYPVHMVAVYALRLLLL